MLAAIQRIVRGECQAAGSPKDPDFETLDSYPLTVDDAGTTRRVAAAFSAYCGDRALQWDQQTASEDFSNIPRAADIPFTYWAIGGTEHPRPHRHGHLDDLPANHSRNSFPRCSPPCAQAPRP